MMMERVWWEQIPNAGRFLKKIEDSLLEGESVILKDSDKIPWLSALIDIVSENVHNLNAERTFTSINASEVDEEPGEYMLERFCKEETRAKFRPGKGYANFLADLEASTLSGSYINIRNAKGDNAKKWAKFIAEYAERLKGREGAIFLLETAGADDISKKKGVNILIYQGEVSPYDAFVFNMLITAKFESNYYQKAYLAELASQIAKSDIELSAACIMREADFLKDPGKVLRELCYYNNKECARSDEDIQSCIWTAQIKILFPLTEEFRRRFIKKHRRLIEDSLALNDYENASPVINDLDSVEVGTISYLSGKYRWPLDRDEIEELKLYKETRNNLAHMKIISFDMIEDIFKGLSHINFM